jgi:glycosyltransferase involved in cell wall biosynthesis
LIEAFHLLHTDGFEDLKLLIIGNDISKYATLRRAIHSHNLHKYVRFLGFVPDTTLAALYRLASAFVFPSLYEGFGFPPLEAMASGAPVVASNISSLPEVLGDAAILVDPYDARSIADGIRSILKDDALRHELQARGLAQVRKYSWETAARQTLAIYDDVARAAGHGPVKNRVPKDPAA